MNLSHRDRVVSGFLLLLASIAVVFVTASIIAIAYDSYVYLLNAGATTQMIVLSLVSLFVIVYGVGIVYDVYKHGINGGQR